MKIANQNIMMASQRSYRQGGVSAQGSGTGTLISGLRQNQLNNFSFTDMLGLSGGNGGAYRSAGYDKNGLSVDGNYAADAVNSRNQNMQLQSSMINLLLSRLLSASPNFQAAGSTVGFGTFGGGSYQQMTYYEEETTSFSSRGQVQTEDGRSIDFNIDIMMSRSFMEYTQINIPALNATFMDPLVINTGSAVTEVSDQKFLFDLDADGSEEYISMPTRGSGFLALDLNGDGIINDGRELFGTQSGDGFGDLRKYDSDGNGWIDENDEIFDKLKVWYKDEDGNDVLVNLKEADVGAIYLGEQSTQFGLYGSSMQANAMIRSTGIFLKESGGVGTVQHVDLATQKQEMSLSIGSSGGATQTQKVTASGDGIENETVATTVESTGSGEDDSVDKKIDELSTSSERRRTERKQRQEAEEARRQKRKERLAEQEKKAEARRAEEKERMEKLFEERAEERKETEEAYAEESEAREEAREEAQEEMIDRLFNRNIYRFRPREQRQVVNL